jgi:hypothetical protein
MTLEALKEILITEGIASVKQEFEGAKLEGSIEGFEACRTLDTARQFERTISWRSEQEFSLLARADAGDDSELADDSDDPKGDGWHEAYWRYRYGTIQIEYVYNVLRVGWGKSPISARAGIRYHKILEKAAVNP